MYNESRGSAMVSEHQDMDLLYKCGFQSFSNSHTHSNENGPEM